MSRKLFFETLTRIEPMLRAGDMVACEAEAIRALRELPNSPFHLAAGLTIDNDPAHAAAHLDLFLAMEQERDTLGAAYVEMNGFDINTDCWEFHAFSFEHDGGWDDSDWLCDYRETSYDYRITGLEELQGVYASPAFGNQKFQDASYLSSIVVLTKFWKFMRRVAFECEVRELPLYVTAHEFDSIARFITGR